MKSKDNSESQPIYDLIVIGGGVVGLACLRAATLRGWKCALVEAEADLLSHASGGNSGIVCTGVDAAAGTLERALIRDSISEFRTYCKTHNIPFRPCGSLVTVFPWDMQDGADGDTEDKTRKDHVSLLESVLEESHIAGDSDAELFSTSQTILQEKESNISPNLLGAVHIPGEIVVDSWVYSISLAAHARENGADIFTNFRVDSIERDGEDSDERLWSVRQGCDADAQKGMHRQLQGKAIVNATGSWSDLTEKVVHGTSQWTTKPRRGQYRVYNSNAKTQITHPLQPIPSQRTKGIFVFSTLYNQLVVGPTALDQPCRTDRTIDPVVAQELDNHIKRLIPNMDTKSSHIGDYVGIRPGTDHRDYQIHLKPEKRWIAVAGIRSTGLTASLGIGNYVVRLLQCILGVPCETQDTTQRRGGIQTTPMPTLKELAKDYVNGEEGCCRIHGRRYRVTHPLTKLGFESLMVGSQSEKS